MKIQNCLKVLVVPFVISLTGCASIVNGTHQTLAVSTPPTTGASCTLTNSKGHWFVRSTPASIKVHRAYGDLTAVCRKHGYKSTSRTFKSRTKGMAFGNAVFGGVIGAGIDAGNGAAYDYPSDIAIPMRRSGHKHK